MTDWNLVLDAYLSKAGTGLYSLVGPRVYPPPGMPRPIAPAAAVSFAQQANAGNALQYPTHERTQFEIVSWGAGPKAARAVARAVYDLLNEIERVDVTVSGATHRITWAQRAGSETEEPDAEQPTIWLCGAVYEIVFVREAM